MPAHKKDDAQRPEKKMFCIDSETDEMLEAVCKRMSQSRSDVVRQAIRNEYMYIVKNTLQNGTKEKPDEDVRPAGEPGTDE